MVSLLYSAALAATIISSVSAHGEIKSWKITSSSGGAKTFSKSDVNRGNAQIYPLHRTSGNSLICYGSGKNSKKTIAANPGDKVTTDWSSWTDSRHPGPIETMMARCPDTGCNGWNPSGSVWFRIQATGALEDAKSGNGGKWASDKLKSDGKRWTVTIPSGLKKGNYIIRQNIIAMHLTKKPEFYPNCAHITIGGSGTGQPTSAQKFAIPGYLTTSEAKKMLDFNIFRLFKKSEYKFPGPAVITSFAKRSLTARDEASDETEETEVFDETEVFEDSWPNDAEYLDEPQVYEDVEEPTESEAADSETIETEAKRDLDAVKRKNSHTKRRLAAAH